MPCFYHDGAHLYGENGVSFDPSTISFHNDPHAPDANWTKLTPRDAVAWLQARPERIRPPIGVIGPREATDREYERAYHLGSELARAGLSVLCGGRNGVMEAVCKGVSEQNGVCVGLVPDKDWKSANPYVGVPVATGVGIARNALIACASHLLIAVGAGLGTISEMALGLQFEKRVFSISDLCPVPGVETYPDYQSMENDLFTAILNYSSAGPS